MGDFYGLETGTVGNERLQVEYLLEAGPRLVRLSLAGVAGNLLAEVPEMTLPSPYGPFHVWGGHRLWHAPEVAARTYVPDDKPVSVEKLAHGVRLLGAEEPRTGIRKRLELVFDQEQAALTIEHKLTNEGLWAVELAPWALTAMPLGGTAILPQPIGPIDEDGLLPNRHLVLWPYTPLGDERLRLGDDFVLVEGDPHPDPLKVGIFNRAGWIAYLRNDILFCKRFDVRPGQTHPDNNCNVEVYTRDLFLEVETLGPLVRLAPGASVTHRERWEVYTGITLDEGPAAVAEQLRSA